MEKEDIEQAAHLHYEMFSSDAYMSGPIGSYVAGAEWRVNSIWHPANEEPIKHICLLLIEGNNGEFDLGYTFEPSKTKRWAYVKDLIPNTEG